MARYNSSGGWERRPGGRHFGMDMMSVVVGFRGVVLFIYICLKIRFLKYNLR
jgi:hypothetical protein